MVSVDKVSPVDKIEEKLEHFEKKFQSIETKLEYFAKAMNGVCDHIDDLAVELNDDIGNLTIESEENMFEKTFSNPLLKCELCEFTAKTDRGLKTHKTRKHINCDWCDYICNEKKELEKHKMDNHTLEYGVEMLQNCYL